MNNGWHTETFCNLHPLQIINSFQDISILKCDDVTRGTQFNEIVPKPPPHPVEKLKRQASGPLRYRCNIIKFNIKIDLNYLNSWNSLNYSFTNIAPNNK